jgi:hypothetical protein
MKWRGIPTIPKLGSNPTCHAEVGSKTRPDLCEIYLYILSCHDGFQQNHEASPQNTSDRGVVVSINAFQALERGSIPLGRIFVVCMS